MPTYRVGSLGELNKLLQKHSKERQQRIERAVQHTAERGVSIVRSNVPVAFAELEQSVHADDLPLGKGSRIVADAPHAAPVEEGSRPHMPPLEPLIKWVKLRGLQGLGSDSELRVAKGTTTFGHARSVAGQIRALEKDGAAPADAPTQIARAIQMSIAKSGTRPHWFALKSLPTIEEILHAEIQLALPDR